MTLRDNIAMARDVSIALFFILASVYALFLASSAIFSSQDLQNYNSYGSPLFVSSDFDLNKNSANVFITANEKLSGVKCVAVEKQFFSNPEIALGDLERNDETVCKFKLSKPATEPLNIEIGYNGKIRKVVVGKQNPQNAAGAID